MIFLPGLRVHLPCVSPRFLIFDSWACEAPTLRPGERDPKVPVTVRARLRGVCVACVAGRGGACMEDLTSRMATSVEVKDTQG